ncbi:hypothetical protein NEHOM01_2268 [Nematocida homosporus]|uniref:uncharacterized protein n=1 Tax=Nematocida homosporus TaxID=1912981 RepID=UPI00222128C2|nr:uncharacterized protein NEHOM01_2268 [Nematocida homosporus]KAI5187556.1 hypothetical protein NEHOM01_2268 [Nematocida homosporus]
MDLDGWGLGILKVVVVIWMAYRIMVGGAGRERLDSMGLVLGAGSRVRSCKLDKLWVVMELWTGLLLLRGVMGSDELEESVMLDEAWLQTWPAPDKMIGRLNSLGFYFNVQRDSLFFRLYMPRGLNEDDSASNPLVSSSALLQNVPVFVVVFTGVSIRFDLPRYLNADKAMADLAILRKIAVIYGVNVTYGEISCANANPECYRENVQVLSRVVNMFTCESLSIKVNSSYELTAQERQQCFDVCYAEARNTVAHISSSLDCRLTFSSNVHEGLMDFLSSGIVMLRQISNVGLTGYEFQVASSLRKLPLAKNYTVCFQWMPDDVTIDCSFLQAPSPLCKRIVIDNSEFTKLKVTGLDEAVKLHPMIDLTISWEHLCLLVKNNDTMVQVYSISGIDAELYLNQVIATSSQKSPPLELRVFAAVIYVAVDVCMPCRSLARHKDLYSVETCALRGISVDEFNVFYSPDRIDLYQTLKVLKKISALTTIPADVCNETIVCCGEELSKPGWTLSEAVNIVLNGADADRKFADHQNARFCQNIHYRLIDITAAGSPYQGQVQVCTNLLRVFQNITARQISITDVRDRVYDRTKFNIDTLKSEMAATPKYYLDLQKLILDNVDEYIIYWVLGSYNFVGSIKVYILNQRFTNLAIAQALSLPIAHNITTLVMDDFITLNEVGLDEAHVPKEDFSLFRYIREKEGQNQTHKDLGLYKLILMQRKEPYSQYVSAITRFLNYGVNIMNHPFQFYINNVANRINADTMDRSMLGIYDITPEDLATDIANCQLKTQSQDHSIHKNPVEKLFLNFADSYQLTETNLSTILQWVSCRFKRLNVLQLSSVTISSQDWNNITSRKYLAIGLGFVKVLYLTKAHRDWRVNLLIHPCQNTLLTAVTNPQADLIVVSGAILSWLFTHQNTPDDRLAEYIAIEAYLRMIITDLQRNPTGVSCLACCYELYVPSTRTDEEGPLAKRQSIRFSETDHFKTFCYFRCGHTLCSKCALQIKTKSVISCPTCRGQYEIKTVHRLISIPFSSFVFIQDNSSVSAANQAWLDAKKVRDGQVYFYLSYADMFDFEADHDREVWYDMNQKVYVISG